jgi:hypothetical protein
MTRTPPVIVTAPAWRQPPGAAEQNVKRLRARGRIEQASYHAYHGRRRRRRRCRVVECNAMRPARLTVLAIWMVLAIAGGGCEAIVGAMMRADYDAYLRDNERKTVWGAGADDGAHDLRRR